MNDRFRARSEDSAVLRERLTQARELRKQLAAVTASARSRDGLIGVEVGAQGQLRGVWLDPGVFDHQSPQRLAAVIVELAGVATAEAARRAREIMAPLLPTGKLPAGDDLTALIPPVPDTLGRGQRAVPW